MGCLSKVATLSSQTSSSVLGFVPGGHAFLLLLMTEVPFLSDTSAGTVLSNIRFTGEPFWLQVTVVDLGMYWWDGILLLDSAILFSKILIRSGKNWLTRA